MSDWPKSLVEWVDGDTAYVSVPFTWLLHEAGMRCAALHQEGYRVKLGGPAVELRPDVLAGIREIAEVGGHTDALRHHNPNATFTSRGCIRQCAFCGVPQTEGDLRELSEWEPKPIVCDNNLLACSRRHFDRAVDSLKGVDGVDFEQGLDARLLTDYHAGRIGELDMAVVRFAWDHVSDEPAVMDAIAKLNKAGIPNGKMRAYVLLGFDDTPDEACYRLEMLKGLGIWPHAQRFQPKACLEKNSYVSPAWTEQELSDYMHYWNRLRYFRGLPFAEYRRAEYERKRNVMQQEETLFGATP